ncbi:hypothetical protein K1T71_000813 [Dendrolimus kikuchii]|uniref:Uncharacterized protein n=1 Tax=Dendrolimus kikuchii TaxID=765133 RepID=A0ACC1DKM3_9NEOP|nr:hypothetical protein K1T71_000813 [Dendrolimus kikuchii]
MNYFTVLGLIVSVCLIEETTQQRLVVDSGLGDLVAIPFQMSRSLLDCLLGTKSSAPKDDKLPSDREDPNTSTSPTPNPAFPPLTKTPANQPPQNSASLQPSPKSQSTGTSPFFLYPCCQNPCCYPISYSY